MAVRIQKCGKTVCGKIAGMSYVVNLYGYCKAFSTHSGAKRHLLKHGYQVATRGNYYTKQRRSESEIKIFGK